MIKIFHSIYGRNCHYSCSCWISPSLLWSWYPSCLLFFFPFLLLKDPLGSAEVSLITCYFPLTCCVCATPGFFVHFFLHHPQIIAQAFQVCLIFFVYPFLPPCILSPWWFHFRQQTVFLFLLTRPLLEPVGSCMPYSLSILHATDFDLSLCFYYLVQYGQHVIFKDIEVKVPNHMYSFCPWELISAIPFPCVIFYPIFMADPYFFKRSFDLTIAVTFLPGS